MQRVRNRRVCAVYGGKGFSDAKSSGSGLAREPATRQSHLGGYAKWYAVLRNSRHQGDRRCAIIERRQMANEGTDRREKLQRSIPRRCGIVLQQRGSTWKRGSRYAGVDGCLGVADDPRFRKRAIGFVPSTPENYFTL